MSTTPSRPPRSISTSALNHKRRSRDLAGVREDPNVDLVVIGGGVTGCGIALDAASRGLSVVVLEAQDLAFGTSRWSSKLAHGGLRYLAKGDVKIAYHSAHERGVLLEKTAPHLTRPLAQVIPMYSSTPLPQRILVRQGLRAGDFLARAAGTSPEFLPWSKKISAEEVKRLCPQVNTKDLIGGYQAWDCQLVDDARLVIALARTAAAFGARIVTHCPVSEATGRSVVASDALDDSRLTLNAKSVINATGVWVGSLSEKISVRPSRGSHLVLNAAALGNPTAALTVPVPGESSRFCFFLPAANDRVYLGLTDIDTGGDIDDVPVPSEEEIDFLLDVVSGFVDRPVTRRDIVGSFAGLRPLVSSGDGQTADVSRRHLIATDESGLHTVTGGKLTEYRRMAEEAVDHALAHDGIEAPASVTISLPLVGAPALGRRARIVAGSVSLPESLGRFGVEADAVVESCLLPRPLDPVAEGVNVTRAEFSFHVTHEGALTTGDILDRRTRIGLVADERARALPVAEEALRAAETPQ